MSAYQTANTWSQSDGLFQKLCEGANLNSKGLLLSFFYYYISETEIENWSNMMQLDYRYKNDV